MPEYHTVIVTIRIRLITVPTDEEAEAMVVGLGKHVARLSQVTEAEVIAWEDDN